jgi:hypothetical protein
MLPLCPMSVTGRPVAAQIAFDAPIILIADSQAAEGARRAEAKRRAWTRASTALDGIASAGNCHRRESERNQADIGGGQEPPCHKTGRLCGKRTNRACLEDTRPVTSFRDSALRYRRPDVSTSGPSAAEGSHCQFTIGLSPTLDLFSSAETVRPDSRPSRRVNSYEVLCRRDM